MDTLRNIWLCRTEAPPAKTVALTTPATYNHLPIANQETKHTSNLYITQQQKQKAKTITDTKYTPNAKSDPLQRDVQFFLVGRETAVSKTSRSHLIPKLPRAPRPRNAAKIPAARLETCWGHPAPGIFVATRHDITGKFLCDFGRSLGKMEGCKTPAGGLEVCLAWGMVPLGFPASSAQHAKGHLRAGVALQRHGLARNAAAVPNLSLLKPLDLAWNCPEKKRAADMIQPRAFLPIRKVTWGSSVGLAAPREKQQQPYVQVTLPGAHLILEP